MHPCRRILRRAIASSAGRLAAIAGLAFVAVGPIETGDARAAPVRIYAAGSLAGAMKALIAASGLPGDAFATPVFGPAGLLGERLSKGEPADLFASADMTQPDRLAGADGRILVVPFARNRMCVAAMPTLGLDAGNLLDRLLDPGLRLATSTPGADPGGDYAVAVFGRADAARPGAAAILGAKAMHLLGGPATMVPVDGHSPAAAIFLDHRADALLYYCSSSAALLKEVDGLANLPLPESLEVHPVYGLAVLSDDAAAARFALFVLSHRGQDILTTFGFLPIGPAH